MSHIKIHELENLSTDDLIKRYDETAEKSTLGPPELLKFYLDEISRRRQTEQNNIMIDYTKSIKKMTIIVTIATLVNLVLVIITLCK